MESNKSEVQTFEDYIVFAQKCLSEIPTIVIGSGGSIPFSIPGMSDLLEALKKNVKIDERNSKDENSWLEFLTVSEEKGLEDALSKIQFSPDLTHQLVEQTWGIINHADHVVFNRLLSDELTLPLTRLIQHLFQSTQQIINIVTPNYDRLAEYSANRAGFSYFDGFQQGYFRWWRPEEMPVRSFVNGKPTRTVCIWKVHGSLDWFMDKDDNLIALTHTNVIPKEMRPLIITPGIQKYKDTHHKPFRDLLSLADKALKEAKAFLCIGYGFNDEHIQPKLIENCTQKSTRIVVIVRKLTEAAKHFLLNGKCKNFLAFEEAASGTRVYSPKNPEGHVLKDIRIWDFMEFLNQVL